jgi:hypothetical protein
MKKILCITVFGSVFLLSCTEDKTDTGKNSQAQAVNAAYSGTFGGLELAVNEKIAYENMIIYPIKAKDDFVEEHNSLGEYKTLSEGITGQTVLVTEKNGGGEEQTSNEQRRSNSGGGGLFSDALGTAVNVPSNSRNVQNTDHNGPDVNSLDIENKGEDTVFIMAGELVRGGNQDRVVAEDFVLAPHSGKKDLPVFCVEQSRWTHEGYYAGTTQFGLVNNVVANSIRQIVVQAPAQEAVWSGVAQITKSNDAVSETQSYNSLEESKEFTEKRNSYLTAVKSAYANDDKIIGFIITDKANKVLGCDIFCKNSLFKKEYSSLLHSYITEVITPEGEKKTVKKGKESAETYFTAIAEEYRRKGGSTRGKKFVHNGKAIHYSGF